MTTINSEMRPVVRAARLYYCIGLDQNTVAARMGISQATVSRLLKLAISSGIAKTEVITPEDCFPELEETLIEKYKLRDVIVIPETRFNDQSFGTILDEYLRFIMRSGEIIASAPDYHALKTLVRYGGPINKPLRKLKIVQLLPGWGSVEESIAAQQTLGSLAHLWQAKAFLYPDLQSNPKANGKGKMLRPPRLRQFQENLKKITLAIVQIEAIPSLDSIHKKDSSSPWNQHIHFADNAIGHICYRPYNASGEILLPKNNQKFHGIHLKELQDIDKVIGISLSLDESIEATKAALLGKFVNILITDTKTADKLI